MAKSQVPPAVRDYLSKNGKKGGETTKELIDAGKAAMGKTDKKKK